MIFNVPVGIGEKGQVADARVERVGLERDALGFELLTRLRHVVDPQRDTQKYLADAAESGLQIRHVFLTHFHADFVAGHLELRDRCGATIHLGSRAQAEYAFVPMKDGDGLDFQGMRLRVLETPQMAEVVIGGRRLINLSSNNYLGLNTHPRLIEADLAALRPAFAGPGGTPGELEPTTLRAWARWEARFGIVSKPPNVARAFDVALRQ